MPLPSNPGRGQTFLLQPTRIYAGGTIGSGLVSFGFPFYSQQNLPNNYNCTVTLSGYVVNNVVRSTAGEPGKRICRLLLPWTCPLSFGSGEVELANNSAPLWLAPLLRDVCDPRSLPV